MYYLPMYMHLKLNCNKPNMEESVLPFPSTSNCKFMALMGCLFKKFDKVVTHAFFKLKISYVCVHIHSYACYSYVTIQL